MAFEVLPRCARAAGLHRRVGLQQRSLALGHLALGPHGTRALDARDHHARRGGAALAHRELGEHTGDGRAKRDARLQLPAVHHLLDLRRLHAGLAHALARGVAQRLQAWSAGARQRQVFLLRGHPVGHVQLGQRRARDHAVEHGVHVQLLHIAHGARTHQRLVALVPGHAADHGDLRHQRTLHHRRCAQPEVLLDARAYRDAARVRRAVAGVARHQHHVHEGRLRGGVKLLARHHGVVVVEDAPPRHRVDVAGLQAALDVAPRGVLALRHGPLAGVGGGGRRAVGHGARAGWSAGPHALLHAEPPGATAHGREHDHGGHPLHMCCLFHGFTPGGQPAWPRCRGSGIRVAPTGPRFRVRG